MNEVEHREQGKSDPSGSVYTSYTPRGVIFCIRRVYFGVFSMSHFAPAAFSSDIALLFECEVLWATVTHLTFGPKTSSDQRGVSADLLWSKNVT